MPTKQFDVIVVGAALVGASAAVALAEQALKVALIDRKMPSFQPENESVWDSRIYAISPGNADWLKTLNVWQRMSLDRVAPIDVMHICSDDHSRPLVFSADEAHADNLGFILENAHLHQALWQSLKTYPIEIFEGEALHGVVVSGVQAGLRRLCNNKPTGGWVILITIWSPTSVMALFTGGLMTARSQAGRCFFLLYRERQMSQSKQCKRWFHKTTSISSLLAACLTVAVALAILTP